MTHSTESSFGRHQAADRRLVALHLLVNSAGYAANEYLIEAGLGDQGHVVSNDQVRGELSWLAEQGLITTDNVGGVTVAKLTRRGHDVAHGKAHVPGVKRPVPM